MEINSKPYHQEEIVSINLSILLFQNTTKSYIFLVDLFLKHLFTPHSVSDRGIGIFFCPSNLHPVEPLVNQTGKFIIVEVVAVAEKFFFLLFIPGGDLNTPFPQFEENMHAHNLCSPLFLGLEVKKALQ